MATHWDASRDYDSQTFSEDYNLHGASDRSHDHPSVTRDDDFFGALNLQDRDGDDQDYGSLEDADLDLIADIVDGKAPHQITSLLRYVLDGSQEDMDYHDSPAFDPTQPPLETHMDIVPLADHADEDHFREWSGSTPKRQTRSAVPAAMTAAPSDRILAEGKGTQDKIAHGKEILKPIVRSAMKPPNSGQGKAFPSKGKLVRHIQLPTELLDESDPEDATRMKDAQQFGLEENKENIQETKLAVSEVPAVTESVATAVMPGPSRFTRMSKKNVSPAKKPLATIPTPQDDDSNAAKNDDLQAKEEQVSNSVKELKRVLRTLRLPLTDTLEASLDVLDAATITKGGLCEMMHLLLQLGGMYEKKEEVLHQMTDQIIAHQEQPRVDPTANKRIQELSQELETIKHELVVSQKECQALETKSNGLATELSRLNNTKDEETQQYRPQSEKRQLLDAASQVSGTWGSMQDLLQEKNDRSETSGPSSKVAQQSKEAMATNWQGHVLRMEEELKAVLSSASGLDTAAIEVVELEDRLEAALLDNQRLQSKNRQLTKELLSLHENAIADEHGQDDSKYKPLIQAVMSELGVKNHHRILPVLEEIERILQDVPKLRRFIASTEKIVWESEILEGTVKVRSLRGIDKGHPVDGKAGTHVAVGRTCSMGYEETLQRLKEWSELLDVLNHVEFAEDIEDTATLVQS
ncbi:hypothetical protein BGZ70_007385 [Mortierella alpina]|uniref:Uncharacterized protein n=1 Tax=Mortierella alpina TaxID=64518 RepID=A0A9P6J6N1_MORAP|nr:hypothetical protein BGZ70_007385 [Mortierella alpina]